MYRGPLGRGRERATTLSSIILLRTATSGVRVFLPWLMQLVKSGMVRIFSPLLAFSRNSSRYLHDIVHVDDEIEPRQRREQP